MKALIAILIILVVVYGFTELVGFYNRTSRSTDSASESAAPTVAPTSAESLSGLPFYLESSLAQAQQEGVESLGKWLKTWSKQVQDPRLAWIELDYVVLLNLKDRKAAREKFQEIKGRVSPGTPVYDRLKKLESAYE